MLKESYYEDIICGHGIVAIPGVTLHVYLYLVDGLLIDTGPASLLKKSKHFFLKNEIKQVALTHIHEDHSGGAPWIKDHLQVPVYLHPQSLKEAKTHTKLNFIRKIVWGNRPAFIADAMPKKIISDKYTFDIIDSPGHHPHQVVLHEKNKGWLFTGDLYVKQKQHVSCYDENTSDVIATLEKLLELDFDVLFCGHAGVQNDGKNKLKVKLDHFKLIKDKVLDLYNQGYPLQEICKILYPKKELWTIISRGEWSSYNLIKTILPPEIQSN